MLYSLSFPVAIIKLGKVEDTVKMNVPEENSSDAIHFYDLPCGDIRQPHGYPGSTDTIGKGTGKEDSIFLLLKCKET